MTIGVGARTPYSTIAGSIQKIDTSGDQVYFFIQHQVRLPPGKYDPFSQYTSFSATLYSSKMDDAHLDKVPPEFIVSHIAQYACSSDCAVILNLPRVSSSLSVCCISKVVPAPSV